MGGSCRRCSAFASSVFGALEESLAERLERAHSLLQVRRGERICNEGAPAFAVYCVESGSIKLTRVGERGDVQVIRLLGPSGCLGLRPILADDTFAVTATALEDCRLCIVPREVVSELLRASTRFSFAVMALLARELRYSENMLMVLTQRPVRRRVADILLLLNGHRVRGDEWEPFPPARLQRKELASLVGTTPETLSRVLADFGRRGLIRVTRRDLELLKPDALQTVKPARFDDS